MPIKNHAEVLRSFLGKYTKDEEYLHLPNRTKAAYSQVILSLKLSFTNIDSLAVDLQSESEESIVAQFYRLFPAHVFKFLQAFALSEQQALERKQEANVLAWPKTTIIDIGCGAGAASIAILALLESYQEYLFQNNYHVYPLKIQLIGFDPNNFMLKIYKQIAQELANNLSSLLIEVDTKTISGYFPKDFWKVTNYSQPSRPHSVYLAMSNVIRPLENSFRRGETKWQENYDQRLFGESPKTPELGTAETREIKKLMEVWQVDKMNLLGVAVGGNRETRKKWSQHLDEMFCEIAEQTSPHFAQYGRLQQQKVFYENPQDSYWREKTNPQVYYDSEYDWGFIDFTNKNFHADQQWIGLLAPKNLELAWIRARRFSLYGEMFADEIECRLFSYEVSSKLQYFRKQLFAQNWFVLNVENNLPYEAPKQSGNYRPRSIIRVEDQIVGALVVQSLGMNARLHPDVSYSFHLNGKLDEFLYKYWLHLWKKFLNSSQEQAQNKQVFVTDLSGFFQGIVQEKLFQGLIKRLSITGKTENALKVLIFRDCGVEHEPGYGIPQGHIASGFWANVYLTPLDEIIKEEFADVSYARYTDDMIFTFPAEHPRSLETELGIILNNLNLNLELSEDKTMTKSGNQFIQETSDSTLDDLSSRYEPLMIGLFNLNAEYKEQYKKDKKEFVQTYQKLLAGIPIYISGNWLRRKINEHINRDSAQYKTLNFPPFIIGNRGSWASELLKLNPQWANLVQEMRKEFTDLFFECIEKLADSDDKGTQKRVSRKLSFVSNRLCKIGLDKEVAEAITEEIVKNPWRFRWVDVLTRGLATAGYEKNLLSIIEHSNSSYVRALALRALAEIEPVLSSDAFVVLWQTILNEESDPCEKLKASEALIHQDLSDRTNPSRDNMEQLILRESNPYLVKNYIT